MKLIAVGITCFFGTFGTLKSDGVLRLLVDYIKWTQTGDTELSQTIFEAEVDLTFQKGIGECTVSAFPEYQGKVEDAATSISRSMDVTHFGLSGNRATAYLTDLSGEGDFSLLHILNLRKRENKWRISAIKIIDGLMLHFLLSRI